MGMTNEPTLADIARQLNVVTDEIRLLAETMSDFATNVDGRFDKVDQRFERLETRMTGMESRMTGMDTKMTEMGAVMVTKEYLDDKLANLRGDLVVIARKSDRKLSELVEELVHEGSLSRDAARKIMALEPFPQR
jgi:uncharacterized coiled-coil protein SlyX